MGIRAQKTRVTVGILIAVILAFLQLGLGHNLAGIITNLHDIAFVVVETGARLVVRCAIRFAGIQASRFEFRLVCVRAQKTILTVGVLVAIVFTFFE